MKVRAFAKPSQPRPSTSDRGSLRRPRKEAERCTITSRRGSVALDPATFRALGGDPRYRAAAEIIVGLSGEDASQEDVAFARDVVTNLVRHRLLDVVPATVPGAAVAPA